MTETRSAELVAGLLDQVTHSPTYEVLLAELRHGTTRARVTGLAGSARALVIARVHLDLGRPVLVVVSDQETGEALRDDLEALLGADSALHLPEFETSPYDIRSPQLAILDARLSALARLLGGHRGVIVATSTSVATPVVAPEILTRGVRALGVGDREDADHIARWLGELGYRRVPLVEEPGDVARHGGIVDVFSFSNPNPVRIEFDDDEIISLREFDPLSQGSIGRRQRILLLPRHEMVIDEGTAKAGATTIVATGAGSIDAELHATQLLHERYYVGMRRISGFITQGWGSVMRYFPPDLISVLDRPERLADPVASSSAEIEAAYEERRRHRELVSEPAAFLSDWKSVRADILRHGGFDLEPVRRSTVGELLRGLDLPAGASLPPEIEGLLREDTEDGSAIEAGDGSGDVAEDLADGGENLAGAGTGAPGGDQELSRGPTIRFGVRAQESFGRSMDLLEAFMNAQMAARNRTVILCDHPGQRDRLRELLGDRFEVEIEVGHLSAGFLWREIRLCILTDHEIFARFRRRRRRRFRAGIALPDLVAIKPGDHVVHVDHGIGLYRGTRRLTVDGHETDCLEIHYQRGDKLFLPADQFDLVQKYPLEEGQRAPGLSRLGGTAWTRTKEKAKQAIRELAEELLRTGALRATRPGVAFSPDTVWQRQLEASFIFDDTPDQVRATQEIKRDMEKPQPMDRLICGDVGYGKTEVAVRAAFKAVQDAKQVAILVPTTILAQQHYVTFSERLAEFPVRIEVLSRFRSTREQRQVIDRLRSGDVDIVIGTHRLLQKDVGFRDLGLIVIDEEQRFGVKHKERLKQLKTTADVLTLTATPIPRTMYLSLSGARDISIINTPPRDRVPIHTEICEFDRELIVDSLLREADRGGQSFFVHNRVQSIDSMAGFLRRVCPQLRFAVAHGQMPERGLEQVIVDFMDRKYDVLITSMIIESGVDMPTVNTMLVNRADRLGLAQLYQLRGRVGRSSRRAHCYLLVPPHRALTEPAERRLRVIEEYDELGSGFKIAMKDLEIRGAGNILGAEQHGHILSVGFDLYCRLLEEAVAEVKGESPAERMEARVVTELDAYLPDSYVGTATEKITFYKRLADTREAAQVRSIEEELTDRFGRLPSPAEHLLALRHIKLNATAAGIAQVDVGNRRVRFEFAHPPTKAGIQNFLARTQVKLEFRYGDRFSMTAREVGERPLSVAMAVLEALVAAAGSQTEARPAEAATR